MTQLLAHHILGQKGESLRKNPRKEDLWSVSPWLKNSSGLLGQEQVFLQETDRLTYAYDAAVLEPVLPALVVRPESPEDLGQVVRLCNDHGLPLTVRGAGTNLSGGTIPGPGGVVVLTNALNQILEINEADLYAVVQPGVITAKLAAGGGGQGPVLSPRPRAAWRSPPWAATWRKTPGACGASNTGSPWTTSWASTSSRPRAKP